MVKLSIILEREDKVAWTIDVHITWLFIKYEGKSSENFKVG